LQVRIGHIAAATLALCALGAHAKRAYEITPLTPGAADDVTFISYGRGLNDQGQAVVDGHDQTLWVQSAYLCDVDGCAVLPSLSAGSEQYATAAAINESGQVTGTSLVDYTVHAYIAEAGKVRDLGSLPEDGCNGCSLDSQGAAINDRGHVVGTAYSGSGDPRAFVRRGRKFVELGMLGGSFSFGTGLNNAGTAVGYASTPGDMHVRGMVVPKGGEPQVLGTLGGSQSWAYGINNAGEIAGCATVAGEGASLAAVFTMDGAVVELGTLGGAVACALAIDDKGRTVGRSMLPTGSGTHAFLHNGRRLIDLNDKLADADRADWELTEATAINRVGQIVGTGLYRGVTRAFLMTPSRD